MQYDWYFDGSYFGSGQFQGGAVTDIGAHTIGLQVIANGLPSQMVKPPRSTWCPITISDGLSNEYEQTYGINPLDRSDSAADPDGDGLQTLEEQQIGSSPTAPDTDGDGMYDGEELALGGSPTDPNILPRHRRRCTWAQSRLALSTARVIRLPNPGASGLPTAAAGQLNWSAESNAAWLDCGAALG